jgi:hypothetical protein
VRCRYGPADVFSLELASGAEPWKRLQELANTCEMAKTPGVVHSSLDDLWWSLLDATLRAVNGQALKAGNKVAGPHFGSISEDASPIVRSDQAPRAVRERSQCGNDGAAADRDGPDHGTGRAPAGRAGPVAAVPVGA